MSIEKMLGDAIVDIDAVAEQAASAARANAERHNKYAQRLVGKLREVYEKITKAEDEDEIESLEEEAAELAESLEIEFVYVRADGTERKYTPQAFWEPSGGCEWEESAQYGYDYGWQI